jgi:hypothetical protein
MKTGERFSCIQEMNDPNTREDFPPSVEPDLRLPAKPFSSSSIQSTHGAMASAVWITARRLDSDWPTSPAKMRPASRRSNGTPNTLAVAFAVSDLPQPGMPSMSTPLGMGRTYCFARGVNASRRLSNQSASDR